MQQVKQPGKFHKVERYVVAQLPIHPQYIDAGTVYFAELQEPLDFGAEPLTPEMAASLGAAPPPGSFVRTLLMTPLNSASTPKGAPVEAILSQPLFDGTRLILPQGCRLRGSVVQVQPARYMSRNGQLRMVFHELLPPEGAGGEIVAQKVEANLEGVQAAAADNVALDAEGGAQAGSPKSRYLLTTISIGLAAVSAGVGGDTLGDTTERAAGGAGRFQAHRYRSRRCRRPLATFRHGYGSIRRQLDPFTFTSSREATKWSSRKIRPCKLASARARRLRR